MKTDAVAQIVVCIAISIVGACLLVRSQNRQRNVSETAYMPPPSIHSGAVAIIDEGNARLCAMQFNKIEITHVLQQDMHFDSVNFVLTIYGYRPGE